MEKGTKVQVNLKKEDATKLGIATAEDIVATGIIESQYANKIAGHYVTIEGKLRGIPDRLNALTPIEAKQEHEEAA